LHICIKDSTLPVFFKASAVDNAFLERTSEKERSKSMTHVDCEAVFRRQHPLYRLNRPVWEKSRDAYAGGADYIRQALVKHVSEIELEFEERLRRACYFNYPRKIARLITQFVLSADAHRDSADPALVEDFSRDGMRTVEVMRQFSTLLNLYGAAALWVDMPFFDGEIDLER